MSLMLLVTDCREPFMPDFETGENDYLVVEGFIHVGNKAVTTITLSRVTPLQSTSPVFENDASLYIESANGIQYPLSESESGIYASDSLDLDTTLEYRLHITTNNGNEYVSNYQKSKTTPAIDSIHWRWEDIGIQMYVATHDDENNTQYYKWDYEETWEIHSAHKSKYSYNNGEFRKRYDPEIYNLYWCWQSESADDLKFSSTEQLEFDRMDYPLTNFAHNSDRTSVKYSIYVEQRSLSKEEFDYLQLIQKNSTVTGSIFDSMPSEIQGNLESITAPDEHVIGFIGAYTTQSMRIFISAEEFEAVPVPKCDIIDVYSDGYELFFGSGNFIPVDSLGPTDELGNFLYTGAPVYCMDCKLRGSPKRPEFWE